MSGIVLVVPSMSLQRSKCKSTKHPRSWLCTSSGLKQETFAISDDISMNQADKKSMTKSISQLKISTWQNTSWVRMESLRFMISSLWVSTTEAWVVVTTLLARRTSLINVGTISTIPTWAQQARVRLFPILLMCCFIVVGIDRKGDNVIVLYNYV